MGRTFGLFAVAVAMTGCLTLADTYPAFARTKRVHQAREGSVPTDQVGSTIWARLYGADAWPGYAPHGWFGTDPTASSRVWTGPCWGGDCLTYTPGFGPQRQPKPLLP